MSKCTSSSTRSMLRRARARICAASRWLRAGPTNSCSGMKRRHSSRYLSSSSMIRIDDTSALPQQAAVKVAKLQTDVLLRGPDVGALAGEHLTITIGERRADALELRDGGGDGLQLGLQRTRKHGLVGAPQLP